MPNPLTSLEEKAVIDKPACLKRNNSIPEIPKQHEENNEGNNDEVVENLKELAVHLALTN